MTYGVVPGGFSRKPMTVILSELEEAMIAEFGPDVIQTAQSPLGQINGLMASMLAFAWEVGEDVYQSFDIDGAYGPRLDMLGKLRRLDRPSGEQDADFQFRLTNQGQADISLTANLNRIKALSGVAWASVHANSMSNVTNQGLPAHAVAYAVIGGDDQDVGLQVYQQTVPGIILYGNTEIEVVADGFCQKVRFIRPVDVPIRVEIDVQHIPDACNCAPATPGSIVAHVIEAFAGKCGYRNGDTVTVDRIAAEAARAGDLKIVDVRIARASTVIVEDEIETTLFERPVIISPYVSVRYV